MKKPPQLFKPFHFPFSRTSSLLLFGAFKISLQVYRRLGFQSFFPFSFHRIQFRRKQNHVCDNLLQRIWFSSAFPVPKREILAISQNWNLSTSLLYPNVDRTVTMPWHKDQVALLIKLHLQYARFYYFVIRLLLLTIQIDPEDIHMYFRKQIGSREDTPLPSAPHPIDAPKPLSLCFSKIPNSGSEGSGSHEDFDRFTVREAALDEEYWTAAWLRAENLKNEEIDRIMEQVKKRLAEREYNALKRRCKSPYAEKCTCIVAVKNKERYGKRAVLNSVVGTLDISIRYLLQGEKYPTERAELSFTGPSKTEHRYGYVSNVCVAKSARRHGAASKMLRLAVQVAKSSGVENVFVHVCKNNMPALLLYEKIGFQVVDTYEAGPNYLMCIQIS